jgi:hypothetical protein
LRWYVINESRAALSKLLGPLTGYIRACVLMLELSA